MHYMLNYILYCFERDKGNGEGTGWEDGACWRMSLNKRREGKTRKGNVIIYVFTLEIIYCFNEISSMKINFFRI